MVMLATPVRIDDPAHVGEALERAQAAQAAGADLIEWRVDLLVGDEASRQAVRSLVQQAPLPCIVTCRIEAQGGRFDGPESDRIELLRLLASHDAAPRYLDIEHACLKVNADLRAAANALRDKGTSLICSAHDFNQQPSDLLRTVADMGNDAHCDVIKVAYQANSLREALQCADLLAQRPKPMIALAMGPAGVISRVLTGAWGGLLTFASLDEQGASAPGQPTLSELLHRYRIRSITPATRVYGLIGWPLGASPGYDRHNAIFVDEGWDAVYLPLLVQADWARFKADVLELVGHPHVHFAGASVTMPHKANCLQLVCDAGGSVDDGAKAAHAANTLAVDADGGLSAWNTDIIGVLEPLRALGADLSKAHGAVLGAGGAARAACTALLQAGASVRVFNRTAERARQVVKELASLGDIDMGSSEAGQRFDVLVQCTSVGMAHGPQPEMDAMDATGFDQNWLAASAVALETIYDPAQTPTMVRLKGGGIACAAGLDMWTAQAAAQQACWAGAPW
jgi:3-dehydroquinate dehydratase/shikimate dehydrogenase